jgi:hypothetical protein
MSLLPPTSSFAERVEALFAVVRGRGMALGPLDRVVLAGWAESGVPLEVVARGMLRAAERVRWMGSGGGLPRTLRACGPEVDEEIAAWKQRRLGAPLPPAELFPSIEVFDTACDTGAEPDPGGVALSKLSSKNASRPAGSDELPVEPDPPGQSTLP